MVQDTHARPTPAARSLGLPPSLCFARTCKAALKAACNTTCPRPPTPSTHTHTHNHTHRAPPPICYSAEEEFAARLKAEPILNEAQAAAAAAAASAQAAAAAKAAADKAPKLSKEEIKVRLLGFSIDGDVGSWAGWECLGCADWLASSCCALCS